MSVTTAMAGPCVRPRARSGVVFGTLLVICALYAAHAAYLACVAEDSYISYRFARHVAEGHGLVWNIGEAPIEGYTNFLWVLVSAAAIRAGVDVLAATQSLGLLFGVGIVLLTYRFARQLLRTDARAAVLPCVLLAASGPLAAWATSGMETTAFAFFLLLSVYAFLRAQECGSRTRFLVAVLPLIAASLLRPEGLIIFGLLAGIGGLSLIATRGRNVAGLLAFGCAYAVFVSAFVVWRYSVFGELVPNTYHAKTGGTFWQYARGLEYIGYFTLFYLAPLAPLALIGLWSGGEAVVRRGFRSTGWAEWTIGQLSGLTVVTVAATYLAYIIYAGGDYMAMYRFVVPVLPFLYLSLAALLQPAFAALDRPGAPILAFTAAMACGIGGSLIQSTPLEKRLFAAPQRQHGQYRGIETERWHVARLSLIGRFFDGYKRSPDETLATRAIGAIGWHARMKIDDMTGLADRHIARLHVPTLGRGWAGHEKLDLDYSFNRLPTYIELDRALAARDIAPGLAGRSAIDLADALEANYQRAYIFAPWIRRNHDFVGRHYRLKTVWLDDEVNGEAGFLAFLERKDR